MMRFRISKMCRGLLYLAVGLAVCELAILNIAVLYTFLSVRSQVTGLLTAITDGDTDTPFMVKLMKIPAVQDIIYTGKRGGFSKLIQNTAERIYFVTEDRSVHNNNGSAAETDWQRISYMSFDVSSAGEALFLIRRIKARGDKLFKKYRRLVIDIGANDGLLSSNSNNFIQLGWDAILVEPQLSLIKLAQENIQKYADPYKDGRQKVLLVNALIGVHDGMEDFVLKGEDMESHIFDPQRAEHEGGVDMTRELIVQVPSMRVRSFAAKYKVPINFAVLSIDAEGVSDKILHQWIDGGFRPAYIVYEVLHNAEPWSVTDVYMKRNGYRFMAHIGWNCIFEHSENLPEDAQ